MMKGKKRQREKEILPTNFNFSSTPSNCHSIAEGHGSSPICNTNKVAATSAGYDNEQCSPNSENVRDRKKPKLSPSSSPNYNVSKEIFPSTLKFSRSPSNCHSNAEVHGSSPICNTNKVAATSPGYDNEQCSPNSENVRDPSSSPNYNVSTPIKGNICSYPSPSSTLNTTPAGDSSTTGTPTSITRVVPAKPTPSSANPDNHSSDSRKEGEVYDETDLEIENLLKTLRSSNPQLQNVAKKVGEASMLLQKGVTLMATVRKQLLDAFTDILPTSAE